MFYLNSICILFPCFPLFDGHKNELRSIAMRFEGRKLSVPSKYDFLFVRANYFLESSPYLKWWKFTRTFLNSVYFG